MTEGTPLAPSLYGGSFYANCGACGNPIYCDKRTILKWPVKLPGLRDVKEIGVECPGCGKRWSLGHTSGRLERIADAIIKAKADPVQQAVLRAKYLRAHRELEVDVAARKAAGHEGEEAGHGQERPASMG